MVYLPICCTCIVDYIYEFELCAILRWNIIIQRTLSLKILLLNKISLSAKLIMFIGSHYVLEFVILIKKK